MAEPTPPAEVADTVHVVPGPQDLTKRTNCQAAIVRKVLDAGNVNLTVFGESYDTSPPAPLQNIAYDPAIVPGTWHYQSDHV